MNMQRMARRLQIALLHKGRYIKINQRQYYSQKLERMVTKYVLSERRVASDDKAHDVTILETHRMSDVVKTLAEELRGGDG